MFTTIIVATAEQFADAIAAHPRVLADFNKDNCPGCRMLDKSLERFAESDSAQGVTLLKVKMEDVGEDFFRAQGLRQTPTLMLFRQGEEVARVPGFVPPAKIDEAVRAHLA